MVEEIKVSIIIPVYNVEQYVKECLDSIKAQTLKEMEIICVDDGSTDSSLKILQEYAETDPNIIVIHQENQGAAVARNKAMEMCKGKFVAFMDPDDFYPDNNVLFELYNAAEKNQAFIVGGSLTEMNESGMLLDRKYSENDPRVFPKDGWVDYTEYQYDYYYVRFIFDRKMLIENHIIFPEYRRFQDPPFFVRSMITAQKFYALKRATYCYRVSNKYNDWTEEKLNHYIMGNNDLLELSTRYNLEALHKRVAKRILVDRGAEIVTWMSSDSICNTLEQTRKLLHPELFPEESVFQNGGVDALFFAGQWAQKLETDKKDKNAKVLRSGAVADPFVSVVIPVYNVEKYLLECLKSIANQTLKNIEMICVNDGSTDQSLDILLNYALQDNRITVITQDNGGLSSARNVGAKYARGEYIYFMDSDDWLEEDALEIAYRTALNKNLDVVVFDAVAFTDSEELVERQQYFAKVYERQHDYICEGGVYKGSQLLKKMLEYGEYQPSAWLKVISKKFFVENDLWFYNGILHEDNLYTYKMFLLADRVCHIPRTFFHRRIREDSIMMKRVSFANVYGLFCSYIGMTEFFESHELDEDGRKSAIELMTRIINTARSRYSELIEAEKYAEYALPDYQRMLFHNNVSESGKLKKVQNETYGKLKQAWKDKSEINAKLQRTYKEKSEINAKLQRTYKEKSEINAKLQRTYKEKSEINAKLQKAYNEKFERGLEIKRLTNEIDKLKEENNLLRSQNERRLISRIKKISLNAIKQKIND